jgi:hypothetical protein
MPRTERIDDEYDGRSTALARLHRILRKLNKQAPGASLRAAWQGALGISELRQLELMGEIGRVIALAAEAEKEIRRLPNKRQADLTLTQWPKLTALFSVDNYQVEWRGVQAHLSSPLLELILVAHHNLVDTADRDIPPKTRQRFRRRIERLLDEVERAKAWPDDLRRAIHAILMQALTALREYEIDGPRAIGDHLAIASRTFVKASAVVSAHRADPIVRETLGVTRWMAKAVDWAEQHPAMVTLLVGAGQIVAQLAVGVIPVVLPAAPAPLLLPPGTPVAE